MKSYNVFFGKWLTAPILLLFVGYATLLHAATETPSNLNQKHLKYSMAADADISGIVIKFKAGLGMKLRSGHLQSSSGRDLPAGIQTLDIAREITQIESMAAVNKFTLHRKFDTMTEQESDAIAQESTGDADSNPDNFNLYHAIHFPAGSQIKFRAVEKILEHLNSCKIVDIAYAEPMPALPIATPNLQGNQGYLNGAPNGIDAQYAWTQNGGRGLNVHLIDIEGAWNATHEDLPALFYNQGIYYPNPGYADHGTAVLGVIAAKDNGLGVTGIVPQAQIGVQSHQVTQGITDVATAIVSSANALRSYAGSVLIIEAHNLGPDVHGGTPCACNDGQCNYVAMEWWPANYSAIKTAVSWGVTVVETAGNGSANLDHALYGGAFNRDTHDSGAILVGASLSTSRQPACFTNFGSRIDVHAWGENVATLGYGDLFNGGDKNRFYTGGFNGTSSAGPIVAGAVASIQGVLLSQGKPPLSPIPLRDLLRRTGTLQTADLARNIGTQPNLRVAIADLNRSPFNSWLVPVIHNFSIR